MMKTKVIYLGFLIFLAICSCKNDAIPEPTDYPFVIFSEINNITSEGATFNANITNLGNQKILDHGFVWSEGNSRPTITNYVQSLGNNPTLGEFSYQVKNDLEIGEIFSVRAFIQTDKVIVYSNIHSFISKGCLPPLITEFYPDTASTGSVITIIGQNFSSKMSNNKVYFGGIQGNILKADFDTILVQCPNTSHTLSVNIKVHVAKQLAESQKKFTLVALWNPLQIFPGGSRFHSSYFTIGSKGYVCMGMEKVNNYISKVLWEYDTATKKWNQKKEFPGVERIDAIGFSLLNKGYVGLGYNYSNGITSLKDLYEYDPVLDTWSKKANFPGNLGHYIPVNFVINQKLYIYIRADNELWVYDPLKDIWELLPKLMIIENKYILGSCSLNGKGYLFENSNNNSTRVWEFDPIKHDAVEFSNLPLLPKSRYQGDFFGFNNCFFMQLANGEIIKYDISDKSSYTIKEPSGDFSLNFILTFKDKVIINKAESNLLYEFCPK